MPSAVEALVRERIRAHRRARGWSLDDLASRTLLSPSTLSRIETGNRGIGLDVLAAIAGALDLPVGALVDVGDGDDDVVIRPQAGAGWPGTTTWPLSRPGSSTTAIKVRLVPDAGDHSDGGGPTPQVHPGHDWLYVLSGTVRLTLGERRIDVHAGEAAEFSTMVPHAVVAAGGPAEVLMIFDADGRHAHLHHGG